MKWRLGSVPYLNAKPLIHGLPEGLELQVPSGLSKGLRDGRLDAALIPVVEYFENPNYWVVPGLSISAKGPVRSVYLAHQTPVAKLCRVALDTSSKTSNLLIQVILAKFFDLKIEYSNSKKNSDGLLLIGDPALEQRNQLLKEGFHLLDLGETWHDQTGLPFVFAFWAMQPDIKSPSLLIETLHQSKEVGLTDLQGIIAAQSLLSEKAARDYLTRCIHYEFAEPEAKGLMLFRDLCLELGLLSKQCEINLHP